MAGMHCVGCERAVAHALEELAGVERACADLVAEEAEVAFDPRQVSLAELRAAVRAAGYVA